MQATSLLGCFSTLEDPRDPRGVRHPFAGMVVLALLGMASRIREMEVLARWAAVHWNELREPLGFDRDAPPVATTFSRTLALCTVGDIQNAFLTWLKACQENLPDYSTVAVDGKTAKATRDVGGRPLHMLNVFVHDLQVVVGQYSVGAEKSNEPTVLRRKLAELIEQYPFLKLITGDAIFAQRPLAELLTDNGIDYLFQIEANQGDTLDALQHGFADAPTRRSAFETIEKKGILKISAGCGLT
jgi:hypothetical protein